MDHLSKYQRKINMQAVRSKGSIIERMLMKALWSKGFRFSRNSSTVFGKPDIAFMKQKIAIFCDSEFWHGYKNMKTKRHAFLSNRTFWINKIRNNMLRDKMVNKELRSKGWKIIRIWGFQILKDVDKCVKRIAKTIEK